MSAAARSSPGAPERAVRIVLEDYDDVDTELRALCGGGMPWTSHPDCRGWRVGAAWSVGLGGRGSSGPASSIPLARPEADTSRCKSLQSSLSAP